MLGIFPTKFDALWRRKPQLRHPRGTLARLSAVATKDNESPANVRMRSVALTAIAADSPRRCIARTSRWSAAQWH